MKRLLIVLPLLLAACAKESVTEPLQSRVQNPLYAERYYDTLVDRMVELDIQNDPLLEDDGKRSLVHRTRLDALEKAKDATRKQHEGTMGTMIGIKEFARGEVLFLDSTLYLSPDFETAPGPELHMLLTTVVDPRDTPVFPDPTSKDLGRIESAYGAQAYAVPPVEKPTLYRTLVLYDTKLGRIYSFAQLEK